MQNTLLINHTISPNAKIQCDVKRLGKPYYSFPLVCTSRRVQLCTEGLPRDKRHLCGKTKLLECNNTYDVISLLALLLHMQLTQQSHANAH
jgi:hypothetical protein